MNYTLEDIKKQSPYPIGELNTAYAKYFVGNSYKFVAKNPHASVWVFRHISLDIYIEK